MIQHERGSGNVFADAGLPNPDEHLVKAKLVLKIDTILQQRKIKLAAAAALFGLKPTEISKMLHGDFGSLSIERLMQFLLALGQDVEIRVQPKRDPSAAPALLVV